MADRCDAALAEVERERADVVRHLLEAADRYTSSGCSERQAIEMLADEIEAGEHRLLSPEDSERVLREMEGREHGEGSRVGWPQCLAWIAYACEMARRGYWLGVSDGNEFVVPPTPYPGEAPECARQVIAWDMGWEEEP